jgi:hypothetical protein
MNAADLTGASRLDQVGSTPIPTSRRATIFEDIEAFRGEFPGFIESTSARQGCSDWPCAVGRWADPTAWSRLFAEGEIGRSRLTRVLSHWRKDADLAGLRDQSALAKLSAQEQKAFAQLWADVAATLKKAER